MKQEITNKQLEFDQIIRRNEEEKESEERKHTEEVTFLKKTNAQLKVQPKNPDISWLVKLSFKKKYFSVSTGGNYCAKKIIFRMWI